MKIIGLMIVKDEIDIIRQTLDSNSWVDGFVVCDNGSTDGTFEVTKSHPKVLDVYRDLRRFDESIMVPELLLFANRFKADWYVDIDADEFFPQETRELLESVPDDVNVVTVNIKSVIKGMTYNVKQGWRRIYRNNPRIFDFSEIDQLHRGKVPIVKKDRIEFQSYLDVIHKQVRSYEQGMRKYENYKRLDTRGIQKSYEHIRILAEALKTQDFIGVKWVN